LKARLPKRNHKEGRNESQPEKLLHSRKTTPTGSNLKPTKNKKAATRGSARRRKRRT